MASEFPGTLQPQQASNVRQAVQEYENAERLGNEEAQKAARKRLAALGIDATASGIREAGKFLADDRVKGRSAEQREVAANEQETADPADTPGGGPSPEGDTDRDEDQAGRIAEPKAPSRARTTREGGK